MRLVFHSKSSVNTHKCSLKSYIRFLSWPLGHIQKTKCSHAFFIAVSSCRFVSLFCNINIFRCVHASLYEGLSVGLSVGPSVRNAFLSMSRLWSKRTRKRVWMPVKSSKSLPNCPKMSQCVPKCPKMSQNVQLRRIVVQMDLLKRLLNNHYIKST